MIEASYTVTGMTCEHCARSVSEEVGELPGVSDVSVDVQTGHVQVTSAEQLSTDAVRAAVEEAGYTLV